MRRAIFGGTFDPIHRAHLVVAREAADIFSLDQVLFIPAANPPHKEAGTPYEHRYKMVELACAEDPRFSASRLEEEARKSYSIYTIERVRAIDSMAGEVFFVPAGVVHDGRNVGNGKAVVLATYIVETGKPVASPVK